MPQIEIECSNCGQKIELTEQLASPLVRETEARFKDKLRAKDQELQKTKLSIETDIENRLEAQRKDIARKEADKARKLSERSLKEKAEEIDLLKEQLTQNDVQLSEARKQQVVFMKKERELEDKQRSLDVELEKRLREEANVIEAKLRSTHSQEMSLKVQEKEDTIGALRKQLETMKQRAEQGSQQTQGESLEVVLENKLVEAFPYDNFTPVSKGVSGADILQEVMSPSGKFVGKILWETKRTKNWHATWLSKLREDQRQAGADIAVLMSTTLPQEIDNFGQVENVWVTGFDCAISLATSLRINLIELANLRIVRDGEATKKELVYDYLTGPEFVHRVEAIMERFADLQSDLQKEKKWMQRMWAKREKQIEGVISSTAGMYGDLEGLAGRAMPAIEGFDGPMLEYDDEV